MVQHLRQHLRRLDDLEEGWQRAEVMTNVFLLSCAIADTVDDYMLGDRFDFSKAAAVVPAISPGLWASQVLLEALQRVREWRLDHVRKWREAWGAGIEEFLKVFVANGGPDRNSLPRVRTQLTSLLDADLPAEVQGRRPRIPAAFRSQDLTHFDILALGRGFVAAFPKRERPVLVVGLRTVGSYFAPLLRALLAVEVYRDVESVTIRPKTSLSRWKAKCWRATQRKADSP